MTDKLVSIIIPTHNRADLLLTRSIPSVLRQHYQNWELLVCGDGASADTEEVVMSFGDTRISYLNTPRMKLANEYEQWCVGGTRAVNEGLEKARGDFIAHLDDDDELLENHLVDLVGFIEEGGYDIVYGKAYFEMQKGWIIFGRPIEEVDFSSTNVIVHSAVLYRRDRLGHLRYDTHGTEPADHRMWKKMLKEGARFGFLNKVVAVHYAEHKPLLPKPRGKKTLLKRIYGGLRRRMTHLRYPLVKLPRRGSYVKGDKLMLYIGSGVTHRIGDEWLHIDIQRGADLTCDVRKGLPFRTGEVDFIYSEHFIEHLSKEEGKACLREFHRVLKPGGVTRIATPDLKVLISKYAGNWRDQTWLRYYDFDTACEMLNACFSLWGHKFLYDEETLVLYLRECGFGEIVRCKLGQSLHRELRRLETRPESTLILEAKKL